MMRIKATLYHTHIDQKGNKVTDYEPVYILQFLGVDVGQTMAIVVDANGFVSKEHINSLVIEDFDLGKLKKEKKK